MKYNRNVLEQCAAQLDDRAGRVIVTRAAIGVVMGVVVGILIAAFAINQGLIWALPFVLIGGAIGYLSGQGEAFRLRVSAHTILLQMQIEQNTRKESPK